MSVTFYAGIQKSETHVGWADNCEEFFFNMANGNARHILKLIGIENDELCGHLSYAQMEELIDRLDDPNQTSRTTVHRDGNGPTFYQMGRTLDQLRGYAHRLELLVEAGRKNGAEFFYYA